MYEAKRRGKSGFVIHASGVEAVSLVPSADAHRGFVRLANDNCSAGVN